MHEKSAQWGFHVMCVREIRAGVFELTSSEERCSRGELRTQGAGPTADKIEAAESERHKITGMEPLPQNQPNMQLRRR